MRSRASVSFATWVQKQGGVRAAGRVLGKPGETVRRWAAGERVPGDADRPLLKKHAKIAPSHWDLVAATVPTAKASRKPPRAVKSSSSQSASSSRAEPPADRAPDPASPPPPLALAAPATLSEMQARLRQIPGQLQALHASVVDGKTAVTIAETLRRLLEGEAKALSTGITAMGTATVEEVEQLRAVLHEITTSCEGCRARVTAALREVVE